MKIKNGVKNIQTAGYNGARTVYYSTKIAIARPRFHDWPEHPSVQINSSSPWIRVTLDLE